MTRPRPTAGTLAALALFATVLTLAGAGLADAPSAGPSFAVSVDADASDATVWQGDEWTVVANVTNVGDEAGTQDVVLSLGQETLARSVDGNDLDLGSLVSETLELRLEPGESRQVEFTETVPTRVAPGPATATVLTAEDAATLEGTVGDASVEIDPAVADETGTGEVVVRLEPLDLEGLDDPDRVERGLKAHADGTQADLLERAEASEALEVRNTFWLMNGVLLEVDHDAGGLLLASTADHVTRIHENFRMEPLGEAAEPTATTTSSSSTTWGLAEIDAPAVWDQYGTKGGGARVAVLDTGIDADHQDLDLFTKDPNDPTYPGGWAEWDTDGNRIQGSTPYDADGHGTHVSGTVSGGDATGTHIGVAPDVELLHGGVLTPESQGYYSAIVAGMQWAAERDADVTSMSLGSQGYDEYDIEPIRASHALGTYVVASIGNDGEGTSGSPGNVHDSLAVGASDANHDIATFSSGEEIVTDDAWGDDAPDDWPASYVVPDVSAPGAKVLSSVPGDDYAYYWGTSMATPHVSGTVALLLSVHPHLDVDEVEEALVASAWKPSGEPPEPDTRYGEGIVDAKAALDYASDHLTGFDVEATGTNSPVTEGQTLNVTAQVRNVGDAADTQTIRLLDAQGDAVDAREDVTLSPGESTTVDLTWQPGDGDAGSHGVTVTSDDLGDEELVHVFPASGDCLPRHPVNVVGDWAFTATNGVTGGQGTADDPYVVEGWCIDAEPDTSAVRIDSTTAHVEVRGNHLQGSYNGVTLTGSTNVRVVNNTLEGNEVRGISVIESPGATLEANTVRDNGWTGITVWETSHETTIRGNEIAGNANNGLWLGSQRNLVEDNTMEANGYHGLSLGSTADETTARGNRMASNAQDGLWVGSPANTVTGNEIVGNEDDGLTLSSGADGNNLTANRVADHPDNGIWADSVSNLLRDNEVEGNDDGLILSSGADGNLVTGNTIAGNADDGVWLFGIGNDVADNTVRANAGTGIGVSAGPNTLTWNTVAANGWGVSVFGAPDVTLERNEILRTENNGLWAENLDQPLDATDNAWGAQSGPSGGVEDCQTGATADGDGDAIGTDDAEVCFDPWLSPRFTVSIEETNSPVLPGMDLTVTVEVENTWPTADTQTVRLEDFDGRTVDRVEGLTLQGGETTTVSLSWDTGSGDWGRSDVTVLSESHSDEQSVTVLPDLLLGS